MFRYVNHRIVILSFLVFVFMITNTHSVYSQCACTNCPVTLPNSGTAEGFLTIAGATSNVLNTTQFVKAVNIDVDHDALRECEITLIAPNGSSVLLSDNLGIAVNNNITYDICILDCTGSPVPDPGFPINFTSNANYQSGQTYTGSYYTYNGACLSTLTGPVNGQWTLRFQDFVGGDGGILNDWSIELANNDGTSCSFVCATPSDNCDAEGGVLTNLPSTLVYCEGDPELDFDFIVDYGGNTPDPALYSYTYLLNNLTTNSSIEYDPLSDFTDLPAGEYRVCGLSYLTEDGPDLPAIDGTNLQPVINNLISDGTICADFSTNCFNFTIIEQLNISISGPEIACVGEGVVYSIENLPTGVTPTVLVTSGTTSQFVVLGNAISVIWASGPGEICVSATNICGTDEACITVDVTEFIDNTIYTIIGQDVVCEGDVLDYTLSPNMPPGYFIGTTSEFGNILAAGGNTVTIEWLLSPTGQGNVCIEVYDPCRVLSSTVCMDVTILESAPPPDIEIPDTGCLTEVFTASIDPSTSYSSIVWTVSQGNIISGQGTTEIEIEPDVAGTVNVCVEVTSICIPPLQTDCKDITIYEPGANDIELVGACGITGNLEVVNPNNDASYSWSFVSGPGTITFNQPDNSSTFFSASDPGTYTVLLSETIFGCFGEQTFTFTLNPEFTISDLIFDCNSTNGYIVSFSISGGVPPYAVNSIQIPGTDFISGFIPFGSDYSFFVTDSEGCIVELTGEPECPCVSDAGLSDDTLIEVCGEGTATGSTATGSFFDGNDTGTYILHTGSSNALGNIIAVSPSPVFNYSPAIIYGTRYYISYVVGDAAGGTVDLTDPCLSVSFGQPVIFYERPTPNAGSDLFTCNTLPLLQGTGSIPGSTFLWSAVSNPDLITITSPDQLSTIISINGSGLFQMMLTESNQGCTNSDIVEILIYPPIVSDNKNIVCDPATNLYTVSFELSGGNPPYFVNNILLSDNIFTSAPISSGTTYLFEVTDGSSCLLVEQGIFNCNCTTSEGTMSSTPLIVCVENGSVTATYNNDGTFDADDAGAYVLHTGSSNFLGTVLEINATGTFTYNPSWQTNTTYYISYVIGNEISGNVDLTDPCLGVAPGQPVIFRADPVIVFNPVVDTCGLVNVVSVIAEAGVSYTWSATNPNVIFSTANLTSTQVTVDNSGSYEVILTANNDVCSATSTLILTYLEIPSVQNIVYGCNDLTSFNANITMSGLSPFTTDIPSSSVSANVLLLENLLSASTTTVLITSSNGCSVSAALSFDCACQSTPGTMSTDLLTVCEQNDVFATYNFDGIPGDVDSFIYILHTSATDVLGTVLATSPDGRFGKTPAMDFNTIYYISYVTVNFVAGNYELQPCSFVAPGQPVIFYENPVINWQVVVDNCNPEATFTITSNGNLNKLVLVNGPSGAVISNLTTSGFRSDLAGNYSFSIESDNNGCIVSASQQVTLFDSPLIENVFADCKGLFFDVTFDVVSGTPPYQLNGTTNISSPHTTGLIPGGDVFTFFVEDSRGCVTTSLDVTLVCNCSTDAGTLTGQDITLCEGEALNPTFPNNYTLEAGDGFVYILHDGTNQNIGNIIWQGTSFPVPYQNIFAGNRYLLVRVVGPLLPNGDIDQNDDCSDVSNSIEVTWSKRPDFVSTADPFYCENQDIFINIENSGTGVLEIFKNQNESLTFINSANGIVIDPASIENGDEIFYRFTDVLGCVYDLGSDEINLLSLPQAGFSGTPFESCINENTTLFLPDYINGEDSGGSWFLGNTFLPVTNNFDVNQNITTDTSLYYIVDNACGTDTSRVDVIRRPLPEFLLSGLDPLCFGEGNGSITILPSINTTVERIEVNGLVVSNLTIPNLMPGEYEIRLINEFGCSSLDTVTLDEPKEIIIDLGPDLLVDSGENVLVTLSSNIDINDLANTTWTLPNGEVINGLVNSVTLTVTDTSLVRLTVVDRNGCTATSQIVIFVRESIQDTMIFEDIVLPNIIITGSGQNGIFTVEPYEQIQNVQVCSIYDRWGNKVYHTENVLPGQISWDGSFDGRQVMDGVFVYRLVLNLTNGKQQSFAGDITVITR
jgi:subtilisin-like proprotein convertase family protein